MPTSPHLSLPYLDPAQAQKHVTHNEALQRLDSLVQLSVASRTLTAPPASPAEGDRYLVAPASIGPATADWTGHENAVALRQAGAWMFFVPRIGWRAWIEAEAALRVWTGSAWAAAGGAGADISAQTLGLNASADAQNRLTVSGPGTLLTHAGAGHQLKLNKAAAADTASLLFQTGFSGRAEMGTAGTDDFAVKVSPNGSTWTTALQIDRTTGASALAAGATVGGQAAVHRGNLLGTVSQAAGVPTGAVIEQGTNANGTYTRYADGTQICHAPVTTSATTTLTWTFPAPFIDINARVTGMPVATAARIMTVQGATATLVLVNGWTTAGARSSFTANVMAVGRWF